MPSFVVHLLVPPLVLLATRRFEPRTVLLLLPYSLLPDADFFVGVHRATLHNLFLLLPLLYFGLRWRSDPTRSGWSPILLVVFAYLASHQLMDMFVGGVVPLWPFIDTTILIDVLVLVNTRTLETETTFAPGSHEGSPETSPIYEFLNGTEFAILVFVLVATGLIVARRVVRGEVRVPAFFRPR